MRTTKQNQTQEGGNLLMEVKHLAIPFSLLLAKNGIEFLMHSKDASAKEKVKTTPKPKPATKTLTAKKTKSQVKPKKSTKKSGGAQECGETGCATETMQGQLTQLKNDITQLLEKYKQY